jgi:hypothetical protein
MKTRARTIYIPEPQKIQAKKKKKRRVMLQEQDVHGGSAEGEILGKRSGFAPSSGPQTSI